ncbi:coiled-coil domain-containing protein [Brassicibacter mesophilus]|uniref:coiled-coil domain-containing protein n=1 Tax=Brassicibacter mesophilus TaxID=745119 RepID=UPI003D2426D2
MIKIEKVKVFVIFCLIIIIILIPFYFTMGDGDDEPFTEIQQKMADISDDEKEILQKLFITVQEIEAMEKEEQELIQEIKAINYEIERIEQEISGEEAVYKRKLNALKQVLKSYQKKGPGSYLEIILNSENFSEFLRNINTLRDITHGTGELLDTLDESKKNMSSEKTKLNKKLILIEEKQKQLKVSLDNKKQLKLNMEDYLVSLKEERKYYQEYMTNIKKMWAKLKPLLSDTTKAFSNIIEEGNVSLDALKIEFSIFSIKGSIDEKTFNDIISQNPLLSEMKFNFEPGKMTIELPKENLVLSGNLIILDNNVIKFEAKEGSFYGMTLEQSSIEELFQEGHLILNLKPLLGDNTLSSVEIEKEKIILTIKPKMF